MSQPEQRVADVDVSAGKNLLQARLLQGLGIMLVPSILAFAALIAVREPNLQAQVDRQLAQLAANERAALVEGVNQALLNRLSSLGTLDTAGRPDIATAAMPEALSITSVPLDDLGTVKLTPGDFGLTSHIEIDLVRRAFNGENPPPEAVRHSGAWRLVYARAFNSTDTGQGVLLAELPISIVTGPLGDTEQSRFALVQQSDDGAATPVIGAPMDANRPYSSAQVGNTQWFVRAQLEPSWLSQLLSGWLWILGAALASVSGIFLGGVMLLKGIPALLRNESDRILESAENKSALKVQVPPLLPLARLMRQMALLTRRQLITAARKSSETTEAVQEEAPPVVAEEPTTEVLAAELEQRGGELEERDDGIPTHIFRSTDIRGKTNDELTDALVERVCRAVAVMAGRRNVQTMAVAYDGRPSSEKLRTIVVKTLLASGRDVVDLGQSPAPLLYFATHETEYDSGIMITGGHDDDDTNGLRVVLQRKLLTSQGTQEILDIIRDGVMDQGSGRTIKLDVEGDYLDKIALDVGVALPLQIVIDSNFGAAAHLAREVFMALGCEVSTYNDPSPGQRPDKDWTLKTALEDLGERVRGAGADLGLLFDSDGDRLHTVTNQGAAVATDQLLMILAKDLLERSPGADIVYDVQCTRHFAPFITRSGGRAVISRSGHANVHTKMSQSQAVLGGEYSGHIFLKDRWYGFDDGVYAAARLVELLSTSADSYHDLLMALPRYVSSPELMTPMAAGERRDLLATLTADPDYPGSRVTTLDGLRVDYADSWGLVQGSSTEEAISFRFEGNDDEAMARVQAVLRKAVLAAAPDLQLPF